MPLMLLNNNSFDRPFKRNNVFRDLTIDCRLTLVRFVPFRRVRRRKIFQPSALHRVQRATGVMTRNYTTRFF